MYIPVTTIRIRENRSGVQVSRSTYKFSNPDTQREYENLTREEKDERAKAMRNSRTRKNIMDYANSFTARYFYTMSVLDPEISHDAKALLNFANGFLRETLPDAKYVLIVEVPRTFGDCDICPMACVPGDQNYMRAHIIVEENDVLDDAFNRKGFHIHGVSDSSFDMSQWGLIGGDVYRSYCEEFYAFHDSRGLDQKTAQVIGQKEAVSYICKSIVQTKARCPKYTRIFRASTAIDKQRSTYEEYVEYVDTETGEREISFHYGNKGGMKRHAQRIKTASYRERSVRLRTKRLQQRMFKSVVAKINNSNIRRKKESTNTNNFCGVRNEYLCVPKPAIKRTLHLWDTNHGYAGAVFNRRARFSRARPPSKRC